VGRGIAWASAVTFAPSFAWAGVVEHPGHPAQAGRATIRHVALKDLIAEHTGLDGAEAGHLARLAGEWQLLADLAFADLLLMCPTRDGTSLMVLAQMRPYTAQTVYQEDQVGRIIAPAQAHFTWRALEEGRIVREGDPVWREGVPIRVEAIPVRFHGRIIAALSQQGNLAQARQPSRLEITYLEAAADLSRMIAEGAFPYDVDEPDPETLPRVGDGLMRLDARGRVQYASPNAVSAYRRLGFTENVELRPFAEFDGDPGPVMEALLSRRPTESEVEVRGTVVLRRALPLIVEGKVAGVLVLLRDVTELRRRDHMLLLKDATIREIHHRVKNNLQTVASLLRLQARRGPEVEAALQESERRIRAIALVHETLSLERGDVVEFHEVATDIAAMVSEGLAGPGIEVHVEGSAGPVVAEVATPLAVVLSELLQNSVDHAFAEERAGRIGVILDRRDGVLTLEVWDDGRGLPDGFSLESQAGLGLQIVRALVESELGGSLTLDGGSGTRARVSVPVDQNPAAGVSP
jgi:two-component system, sensor histidine kinase PdtaS